MRASTGPVLIPDGLASPTSFPIGFSGVAEAPEADMPYTAAQRRLFHEMAEDNSVAREHGTSQREAGKLAEEADRLKRQGREKAAKAAQNGSNHVRRVQEAQEAPRRAASRAGYANHAPGHSKRTGTVRGERGMLSGAVLLAFLLAAPAAFAQNPVCNPSSAPAQSPGCWQLPSNLGLQDFVLGWQAGEAPTEQRLIPLSSILNLPGSTQYMPFAGGRFTGLVTFDSLISILNGATITGNITGNSTINIGSGQFITTGGIISSGPVEIETGSGAITIDGNTTFGGNVTFNTYPTINGGEIINGGLTLNGTLTLGAELNSTGYAIFNAGMTVAGVTNANVAGSFTPPGLGGL